MVRTSLRQMESTDLLNRVAALYTYFLENEDVQTAERAKDLAVKLDEQEFSIAFCGHFSAGKSSMINKIIGDDILPSSPIPTSANLVKVKSGEDYAKVTFKEGKPILYPAPYDYAKVKSYCKDGDQIQSIEISYSDTSLPKDAVILDTPGIDSTDDAHRIATESALHLADLVFYVMDYNHVQSELNFLFTKELTSAGKEVYLIINMIDKHREEELNFAQFKASVEDSFASWGVKPAKIFYTSLKDEAHKENEFKSLQQFINELISNRHSLLPISVSNSLHKLAEEHLIRLEENHSGAAEQYQSTLSALPEQERAVLSVKISELENGLKDIKQSLEKAENELNNKIDEILKNAYLMPFQTRELAEAYLQSCQPDFKVGLFFSKQKTEQERMGRLERFYKDFSEKVKSQIDWHMKELFLQEFKKYDIQDPALMSKAQGFQVQFQDNLLAETVKTGAVISGDYVLQYTNDTAESLKRLAKKELAEIKQLFLDSLRMKKKDEQIKLEKSLQKMQVYANAWYGLNVLKDKLISAKKEIEVFLCGDFPQKQYEEKVNSLLASISEEVDVVFQSEAEINKNEKKETPHRKARQDYLEKESEDANHTQSVKPLISKLNFTAGTVGDIPGFKKIAADLMQKAERLENKQFTVALFGAFSAGKSSFANALIGDKLLPVSPNPTTAAINKIMPVNENQTHGTVLVKVKESKVLFDDVNRSLKFFDMSAKDFNDAIENITKIMSGNQDFDAIEKTHFAFLNAFSKGYNSFHQKLGTTVNTDLNEFKDYVANEEKSCFVELIEVYYDCELTRKGITLVDTPGADSINARHTGVAFDYIKNSDAILFVTYYNHAFSKADREFLIQLGRVKDTFELDKMFFIVNAIDLANNDEEMEAVMEYVEDQLIKYGIRRPSLFGISSLEALKEKLESKSDKRSNINIFEESFYSFITKDLMKISVSSAELEWNRVIDQLRSFILSSQENKDVKEQKRKQLEDEQKIILNTISKQDVDFLSQRLEQEANELVFYIKQRVFLRFSDFVKESFNPALLKDDGRNLKKALNTALDDFLNTFGFDFAQELRATTLRLETYISKLLKQTQERLMRKTAEVNDGLSFSPFEPQSMEGIDFETAFISLDKELFKKALAYFKNPKLFFENNERKNLSDELELTLQEPSDQYLKSENARLKIHYNGLLEKEYECLLNSMREQADEYYEGIIAALKDGFPIEELKEIERKITNFDSN